MLNPPILSPNRLFMGQFAIDASNELFGPRAYMAAQGNALLDLANAEDPDILEMIRDHMIEGYCVRGAILALLNADFDSWVAERN